MAWIQALHLNHFRCYRETVLKGLSRRPVVLYGSNGAGKTNVLEALSLLTPGRGLRGARGEDIQRAQSSDPWTVSAQAETRYGRVRIGTGQDSQTTRRIVRINGEPVKSQTALAEYLSVIWLTPQMDGLFLDGASVRRRFLDRLVFAFDPGHAGRAARYENAMAQRSRLLREMPNPDSDWLNALEKEMAETGTALAAARLDMTKRLQKACEATTMEEDFFFPRARISLRGTVEEMLARIPALEAEEMLKYQLRNMRQKDTQTGGASTGPHRSDMLVQYAAKDMMASQCSTGEQKALLIGLVLAHSRLIGVERGIVPILLLDEVAAHLDEGRRTGLYNILLAMGGQVWLTGTDESLFNALKGQAQFVKVADAALNSGLSAAA